ncbi:peroxidase 27-like [Magnolia sinica]|uniref:peroxidase 27-like n=1 Tax=Magnolia sinica TaxID=86752 RepID=UPI00265A97FF|nr:peroxidase 27-like [Magnolia sinica]
MASRLLLNFLLQVGVLLFILGSANSQGLQVGFYKKTCPNVEAVIRKTTAEFIQLAPSLAAPLLRMHFHDCFVRGCDGSVLINSTATNQAEKSAIPNLTLRGFQVIDAVKAEVEKACPGIVSCADILALVARDVVSLSMGPTWQVPTGRRDGRISLASEALANLPPPFFNITELKASFQQKGLSVKDLVVLSGAHTIGIGHCTSFDNRIYNFTGKGDVDPSMDPNYVIRLRALCPEGNVTDFVEMDPGSSKIFDTDYYKVVAKRRGLFQSDAALLDDNETKIYIGLQINSYNPSFFSDFGVSMVKMGNISVLTGNAGEIRKNCAVIN